MKNTALLAGTLTTGLVASVNAATVQITLTGNNLSSTGGNQLNADLTGDSMNDITLGSDFALPGYVRVRINGGIAGAVETSLGRYLVSASFVAGGVGMGSARAFSPQTINYLNPISFTDSRINGGLATQAWLQVNAFNAPHTVVLTRLIFDDASTTRPAFASVPGTQAEWTAVPEPSGLALLALGAGGLLVRRKRLAA